MCASERQRMYRWTVPGLKSTRVYDMWLSDAFQTSTADITRQWKWNKKKIIKQCRRQTDRQTDAELKRVGWPDLWVKRTLLASWNAAGVSSLSSRWCNIRSRICSAFVSGKSNISCAWLRKCSTSRCARISAEKSFIGIFCGNIYVNWPCSRLSKRTY